MKNIIFFAFLILLQKNYAQSDTLLVGFSDALNGSGIRRIKFTKNNDYFLWYSIQNKSVFYLTNSDTEVVKKIETNEVDGFIFDNVSGIVIENDSFYFLATAIKANKNYILLANIDDSFIHIDIIDTIEIELQNLPFFYKIKKNDTKNIYESIGFYRNVSGQIVGNCYMNFDVIKKQLCYKNISSNINPVIDFFWSKESGNYFISSFGGNDYLVDSIQQVIWIGKFKHDYTFNNVLTHTYAEAWECFESKNDKMTFLSSTFPIDEPYGIAIGEAFFSNDSIYLLSILPLKNQPFPINILQRMAMDHNNDYIIMGVDKTSLTTGVTIPNLLTIAKFSETYEKKWEVNLSANCSFFPNDVAADNNNDIVITGRAQNVLGDDKIYGFLLKIHADGSLTVSSEEPTIFDGAVIMISNPASQKLLINNAQSGTAKFELIDAAGRSLFSTDLEKGENSIDVSFLPSSVYFYRVFNGQKFVRSGKLVLQN